MKLVLIFSQRAQKIFEVYLKDMTFVVDPV